LVLPSKGEINAGDERLRGEVRRLMSLDNCFDDLRRKKRQMHQASDVTIVDALAPGKLSS